MSSLRFFVLGWALGCCACTGSIGGGSGVPAPDRDADGVPDHQDPNVSEPAGGDVKESIAPGITLADGVGPRPLERLSRREYDHSVQDLLGVSGDVNEQLPPDGLGPSGFELPGRVSAVEGRALQALAEQFAAAAVQDLPRLMGCDPSAAEQTCVSTFLEGFAARAYRRPPEASELSRLRAFFDSARLGHDLRDSARLTLEAVLQSPQFLYHWQRDSQPARVENGLIALSPFELASRLSYLVWSSLPDAELLAAASSGSLSSLDGIKAQLERLLLDPRATRSVDDFHLQWLSLQNLGSAQKDPGTYPEFDSELAESMLEETRGFARSIILQGDGSFESLLTAPRSYINGPLAQLYQVAGTTAAAFGLQDLNPLQRAGILTQPAFLSAQASAVGSNPILRGKAVYERVACGVTVAPPPDVPPPAPPSPNLTTRERFAQHAANACAQACHEKFDPPGFAFENYDGIGRYRETENGRAVDASGTISLPLDGPKSFKNAVELVGVLATSSDARQCIVRQWSRYALKRHEIAGELGSLQTAYGSFESSHYDLRELLRQVVTMKTFLYRLPSAGEVTQ